MKTLKDITGLLLGLFCFLLAICGADSKKLMDGLEDNSAARAGNQPRPGY